MRVLAHAYQRPLSFEGMMSGVGYSPDAACARGCAELQIQYRLCAPPGPGLLPQPG